MAVRQQYGATALVRKGQSDMSRGIFRKSAGKRPGADTQGGLVLIDGLLAIVLFAVGILGMVALQATAVSASSDAGYRSEAAMAADQVLAQMWSADPATLAADFNGQDGVGGTKYTAWARGISLPGVSAGANQPSIAVDAANLVTVTVQWSTPWQPAAGHGTAAPSPHTYVVVTQITR